MHTGLPLDGTQRVDSLLILQRLALMGHWEEVEVKVSAALNAASKCGGFLQSELVRLHCAATIALWDEDNPENATDEAREQWLATVREGYAKCIDISANKGLVLLSLFGAVDWLRFEIQSAQFEGVAFHPSLLLALSHTQVHRAHDCLSVGPFACVSLFTLRMLCVPSLLIWRHLQPVRVYARGGTCRTESGTKYFGHTHA